MTGKEFASRLKTISSFKGIEKGSSKDAKLARRQEKQVIRILKSAECFPEYELIGVEEYFADYLGKPLKDNSESHEAESRVGDIIVYDAKARKPVFYFDLKVGTSPKYFSGGVSIISLYNKRIGQSEDGIQRAFLCVTSSGDYRVADPAKMVYWLFKDADSKKAFIMPNIDKDAEPWESDICKKLNSLPREKRMRVGPSNAKANRDTPVHAKDYFPSFPFENHLFDF